MYKLSKLLSYIISPVDLMEEGMKEIDNLSYEKPITENIVHGLKYISKGLAAYGEFILPSVLTYTISGNPVVGIITLSVHMIGGRYLKRRLHINGMNNNCTIKQ